MKPKRDKNYTIILTVICILSQIFNITRYLSIIHFLSNNFS